MPKILHKLAQPFVYLELAENVAYQAAIRTFIAIRVKFLNLPVVAQYKAMSSLWLSKKVSALLDSLDLEHFIVGGLAYDIKTGRITRHHEDIDFAVLGDSSLEKIADCFRRRGYQVILNGATCRINKYGHHADLFYWTDSGDGYVETSQQEFSLRMPTDYFCFDQALIFGETYKVASDEYIICIEPFVRKNPSKEYVARLKQKRLITREHTLKEFSRAVPIYEVRLTKEEGLEQLRQS